MDIIEIFLWIMFWPIMLPTWMVKKLAEHNREASYRPAYKIPASDQETASEIEYYQRLYHTKYLLTKNEYQAYWKLRAITDENKLMICPKVRLLDLIQPNDGQGYMSALRKIQSKHVDFVICDQALHVKAIVELDDSSHDQPDRKERDRFVDAVLTSCGYTMIRTRYIDKDTLNIILKDAPAEPEPEPIVEPEQVPEVKPEPEATPEPQIKLARSGPSYEEWKAIKEAERIREESTT